MEEGADEERVARAIVVKDFPIDGALWRLWVSLS